MRSLIVGFVAHALCLTSAVGAVAETCNLENQDCIASKPPVLMQTSHKLAEVTRKPEVSAITPVDCENMGAPLQAMRNDETLNYDMFEVDPTTGHYKFLYSIDKSRTNPPYRLLNSCGISPITSIIYCALTIVKKGQFLVRLDEEKVEFVARLPWFGTGAGFSPSGDRFYITDEDGGGPAGGMYVVDSPDSLTGYADWADPSLPDLTKTEVFDCPGVHDVGVFTLGKKEYVIGIPKMDPGNLKVAVIETFGSHKTFMLDAVTDGSIDEKMKGSFGASWQYGDRIFFASNGGKGVLELDIGTLNLEQGTVSVRSVGVSDPTSWNDGLNCMNQLASTAWGPPKEAAPTAAPTPAPTAAPTPVPTPDPLSFTSVTPFDCDQYGGIPMQVILNDAGDAYDVKNLEITTGHYTELYSIPRTRTTPPYKKLNSCGISPLSKVLYCGVTLGTWPNDHHELLVRVDAEKIEFVAKIPWVGTGANFNPSGDTYYITRNAGGIYSIPSPDFLTGYADYTDALLTDLSATPTFDGPSLDDVVVVTALHEEKPTDYVVGIPKIEGDLVVAAIEATGEHRVYYSEPITDDSLPAGLRGAFGAAWSFQNKMYFANNRGSGVFEVELSTVSNPPDLEVKVKKMGKSDPTSYNDGINCLSDALKH